MKVHFLCLGILVPKILFVVRLVVFIWYCLCVNNRVLIRLTYGLAQRLFRVCLIWITSRVHNAR